ncbi:asparagine synthase (glutamine-hydrolyzing) [Rhodospirillum rubrum]|uniref:asparagine synthase (glutamine-hydrolyzing) n=1 Tax=Rhodospirillum rubrum (strain ATCC 11170 / ATH 1.1.1 / DSM 467 / LMG 4362 / NCIMB 8255 / S1) TaxID=269796 RepID=Q2RUB1_RHORT|nr:asparagine synthase (glutamine-hydrolyzing) [Rhodospirillum rubrum]ABC22284.1 asparagine synthase (glutamine-hydrolysing) [Rhodospirillum rubrum ATCC 11170]AEO48002.1 asparagine synthase [Rhodospirillum rubrum F11]MBK5953852.1 asparagine synthetase B [Rhodospirillum rubrum]QXG81925.1 asparagine synthase (glutamine-hydrolyzing) [Rhodospirillum rubrum]HAP99846.1 asparagine synthase (glutamine-hydrolyzing) [Rhodospirillum rubrum]
MCGLVAILERRGPADEAAVSKALARLARRGPDGEGRAAFWDGRLLLGHRRLAIFGKGADGAQPMVDPETGSVLVFNGALYNYVELRQALQALGQRFAGESDTEVALLAWRQWGEAAFARFNGMWAMVLLDAPGDRLVVSRDRLGVKPLYLCDTGGRVTFASTIAATLAASGIAPRVDDDAVFDFLVGGLTDHRGGSFFAGIVEVPAGALWSVDRSGGIDRRRFHDWRKEGSGEAAPPSAEALRATLSDAVRLRLRADVPAVALLSGGLDSSIVTRLATAPDMPRGALAGLLTYGYRDATEADETREAGRFAATLDSALPHDILRVAPLPAAPDLDALLAAQEQPFNTPSLVAAFRLYRLIAARGVKVAITGEGADELFAGYTNRYGALLAREHLRLGRLRPLGALLGSAHCPPRLVANRLAWDLPLAIVRPLMAGRVHGRVIARSFWQDSAERFEALAAYHHQPLASRLRDDALRALLPYSLRFADRSGMASGVEVRSPFLDYRVVEAALALPVAAKIDDRGGKRILRQAFRHDLPAEIIGAGKTHGLGMAEQFQVGHLDWAALAEAPPTLAARYLDLGRLKTALAAHPSDPRLWWPLCLLRWLAWVEGGMADAPR